MEKLSERWRTMDDKPNAPTMCVFYASQNETSSKMGPVRDEAYELGYFEDGQFFYLGTGHAVFEWQGDEDDFDRPTHWRPLPPPPEEKTC